MRLLKYTLFQLPGWAIAAVLLRWLWPKTGWSARVELALFALWVAKDFALYPLVRRSYGARPPVGSDGLIGLTAIAHATLDPGGYVRVRGELWRAEVPRDQAPVAPGTSLRVTAAGGMTLYVRRA